MATWRAYVAVGSRGVLGLRDCVARSNGTRFSRGIFDMCCRIDPSG
jgi:hypothetical protein